MRNYAAGLSLFAILIILFGFLNGKITAESFQYISLPGLLYAVLKSLVVVLVLLLALAASLPLLVIDIVLLLFTNYDFATLKGVWGVAWDGVTMDWFWTETSGSSVFFGALILLLISGFFARGRRRS